LIYTRKIQSASVSLALTTHSSTQENLVGTRTLKTGSCTFVGFAALLLAVALGAFILVRLAPGDFLTELSENQQISAETLAALRQQHGLDQPLPVQFGKWLWRAAQGDLGYSLIYHMPVSTLLGERIGNTLWLAVVSLLLAWLSAVPLGVLAGRGRWLERVLSWLSALLLAVPSFLLALVFLLLAARTNWFPLGGVVALKTENFSGWQKLADFAWHLALPATVLALRQFPHYFQQVRASVRESLTQDFILAARAKGLSEQTILFKHALKPAANALGHAGGQFSGRALVRRFHRGSGIVVARLGQLDGQCVVRPRSVCVVGLFDVGGLVARPGQSAGGCFVAAS
jgi:peptide/nickel transport system permease protein